MSYLSLLKKEKNMEYDTLINNGLLISMAQGLPVVEDGAVLIKDGVIKACGKANEFFGVNVKNRIHADRKIIMPGLINCHTHLPMSMFRGLADDLPLDVWLNDHIFPAEAKHVNPESVEKWSRHSCIEMLLSGTTTCCDGYFHEERVAKAVMESGIRAVTGQGVIDFPAPGVADPKENVREAIGFVKRFKDASPRLSPSIFCHSPYTCSKETLIKAKKAAVDLGVLFQIHVAETRNEINLVQGLGKLSVIKYLDSIGILDEKTLLVHSVWIDDSDIDVIKKSRASVVHCPESNMKLASGIAPVPKLIEKGVPVGLGTDGCASNNDHDLFAEMDTAAKLHKVALLDPCVMDARTTLKMATIKGAKAIGLDHITGSIEKGKSADIVLVDMDKPHVTPMYDPFSTLVYSSKASDVSLVMVDGKVLVQEGKIL
ncbi:MtaD: 5-methylthioadenosine/S-adenosylhomocysteine deaminase [Desulfobacula toluolica Tol2]|uniref:MtaD: 5-methylthioadenosine/S-adenosylhomocysteine deaminase n=2 Tax=Desulfobacula toluolica TaxID=28223 RepID=K0NFC1_DESTT|nr:MtaD: 5-methylthioadenosine/S-adenosylhomocysteine deaminase [Desulfobacula toluolica Tol2]